MSVILDSSAVLALLYGEPGKDMVAQHGFESQLLSVNLSEVITSVIDKGYDYNKIDPLVDRLRIAIVPYDDALAVVAGLMRSETKHIGASIGDRACLALARREGLPVLTSDKKWDLLDIDVDIRQIR